jgi:CheY-like chemotaxis protein
MPRVLIADDDPGIVETVSVRLQMMGIESDTANSGRSALRKICERTCADRLYDVVIVDISMPDIDGWHVLKAIKNNPLWEAIKVVVISGFADSPSDLMRIIEFDGVFVEKRTGFIDTVGEVVKRVLENGD